MKHHYVYLLINENNGIMYIGKRSCSCLPDEDIAYMSSSKYVPKEECDKIILETFSTAKEAIAYESYLHKVFDVMHNEQFYNKANQTSVGFDTTGCTWTWTQEHKNKISKALTGKKHTETHRNNNRLAQLGVGIGTKNNNFKPWFISTSTVTHLFYDITKENKAREDGLHYKQYVSMARQSRKSGLPIQIGRFKGILVGDIPIS